MNLRGLMPLFLAIGAACGRADGDGAPPAASADTAPEPVATAVATTLDPGLPAPPPRDAADRCRRADEGSVKPEDHYLPMGEEEMRRGVTVSCALRPGGPEVRLVVSGEHAIPIGVAVHSPPEAREPAQRLVLDNDQRAYRGSGLLEGNDLNGDGWTDLMVYTFSGSGGQMYDVFLYRPASRSFAKDTVLSGAVGVHRIAGRPCAGTSRRSGAGNYDAAEHCWSRGGWVLVRTEKQERLGPGGEKGYELTVRERRDGRLGPPQVDTVFDPDPLARDSARRRGSDDAGAR